VLTHTLDQQVLVKGMDRNRAVEGDVVAIELYTQDKWSQPSGLYCVWGYIADIDTVGQM
jgi:hypothetical protein